MTESKKQTAGEPMGEIKRYVQTSGAMVETFDTFTGSPSGAWVKASDYDSLLTALRTAREERDNERANREAGRRMLEQQMRSADEAHERAEAGKDHSTEG